LSKQLHQGQPVIQVGAELSQAKAAMVLLHGRGATAEDILTITNELNQPEFVYFAPQAFGNTWYPFSFLEPLHQNEPWLSSALSVIADILQEIQTGGLTLQQVVLLGFSQGGCLCLEYAARNAQRYGGLVGLSAGLIGPIGMPRNYEGDCASTPAFLGCDERDMHIPAQRVQETTDILKELGCDVNEKLYSGLGHSINRDEIFTVQSMMRSLL